MRKYLLLATTAMLFAGNAMAASVATDGQSATVNVKVDVKGVCQITEASDINFGSVWLTPPPDGTTVGLAMATNGNITKASGNEYIAKFDAKGTPGSFKVQCPSGLAAMWVVGCADGSGSGCSLSETAQISANLNGTVPQGADETIYISSELTLRKEDIGKNFDVPALKVTLSY